MEEILYEGGIVGGLTIVYRMGAKKLKINSDVSTFLSVVAGVASKEWLKSKGYIKPIV